MARETAAHYTSQIERLQAEQERFGWNQPTADMIELYRDKLNEEKEAQAQSMPVGDAPGAKAAFKSMAKMAKLDRKRHAKRLTFGKIDTDYYDKESLILIDGRRVGGMRREGYYDSHERRTYWTPWFADSEAEELFGSSALDGYTDIREARKEAKRIWAGLMGSGSIQTDSHRIAA